MSPDTSSNRLQCVIVLYKIALEDSKTYQTLCTVLNDLPPLAARISAIIYDNSPAARTADLPAAPFDQIRYQHDPGNGGLAAAYNYALHSAEDAGYRWLWLFDQDTSIISDLVAATFAALDSIPPPEICALVPRLVQDGIVISPLSSRRFHYVALSDQFYGLYPGWLTALNACACLRVSALRAIGGFPAQYWLDYLDHAVFHRLHEQGGRVRVLDVSLQHHLSTNNLRNESGHARYDNVLAAEWQFVRETGWGGGCLVHRFRLLKRAIRTLLTQHEPAFAFQVLRWSLR